MLTHEWLGWLWAAHTDRRWFESQQHCYLSKLTELCVFFFLNIDFCLFWFQFKQSPCVRVWKGSISVAVLHLCACVCWYCAWRVEGLNVVRVFVSYCETLGHYQCLNGAPQITFYLIGTDSKKLHCLLTRYIFVFLKQIVLLFYDLVFLFTPTPRFRCFYWIGYIKDFSSSAFFTQSFSDSHTEYLLIPWTFPTKWTVKWRGTHDTVDFSHGRRLLRHFSQSDAHPGRRNVSFAPSDNFMLIQRLSTMCGRKKTK